MALKSCMCMDIYYRPLPVVSTIFISFALECQLINYHKSDNRFENLFFCTFKVSSFKNTLYNLMSCETLLFLSMRCRNRFNLTLKYFHKIAKPFLFFSRNPSFSFLELSQPLNQIFILPLRPCDKPYILFQ